MRLISSSGIKKYVLIALFIGNICVCAHNQLRVAAENNTYPLCTQTQELKLSTIYGTITITEPILIELIESRPLQRLKEIYQLGVWRYYCTTPENFTRYDHSIGVFALVRLHGGTLEEQIAALLHDVSHTVFSHVGAFFFVSDHMAMDQFQDSIHDWYLQTTGINDILKKYNVMPDDVCPKRTEFRRLEQDLPDLCGDRIDYNIRGALWEGLITPEQANMIVENLKFDNETWYFTSEEAARLIARASLIMTVNIWGSAQNHMTGKWLATALKRAVDLNILTKDDICFSTDTHVWKLLCENNDVVINVCIHRILHCSEIVELNDDEYDCIVQGKFRGINPLVKTSEGLQHLTELDEEFAHEYATTKEIMRAGWKVKLRQSRI